MSADKQGEKITGTGKYLHKSFLVTLILKGVLSVLEIFGGVLLLFVRPTMINHLVRVLTQHDLSKDPNDILFSHLVLWSQRFSVSSHTFAAMYLLSHGMVKLFIVASIWEKKLWAYPAGIAAFLIFIMYQVYRYQHTHSMWLIALIILDIILIYLIWAEYRRVRVST